MTHSDDDAPRQHRLASRGVHRQQPAGRLDPDRGNVVADHHRSVTERYHLR